MSSSFDPLNQSSHLRSLQTFPSRLRAWEQKLRDSALSTALIDYPYHVGQLNAAVRNLEGVDVSRCVVFVRGRAVCALFDVAMK